jgi:hypothetical protein
MQCCATAKLTMQCKDIDHMPILRLLAERPGEWHAYWEPDVALTMPSVLPAFPACPEKLVLAKMGSLIRRKWVDGCACGCRGDFVITPAGLAEIARAEAVEAV